MPTSKPLAWGLPFFPRNNHHLLWFSPWPSTFPILHMVFSPWTDRVNRTGQALAFWPYRLGFAYVLPSCPMFFWPLHLLMDKPIASSVSSIAGAIHHTNLPCALWCSKSLKFVWFRSIFSNLWSVYYFVSKSQELIGNGVVFAHLSSILHFWRPFFWVVLYFPIPTPIPASCVFFTLQSCSKLYAFEPSISFWGINLFQFLSQQSFWLHNHLLQFLFGVFLDIDFCHHWISYGRMDPFNIIYFGNRECGFRRCSSFPFYLNS